MRGSFGLALGLLSGGLVVAWINRTTEGRREVRSALIEAERAEEAGDRAGVFNALDTAVRLARAHGVEPAGGLPELVRRRDRASRAEVADRLEKLERAGAGSDPDRTLGEALTLWRRVEADPATKELAPRVEGVTRLVRDRWLAAHLSEARSLLQRGLAAEALALLHRLSQTCGEMPPVLDTEVRPELERCALEIVLDRGAVVEPIEIRSTWDRPPEPSHEAEYRPRLEEALRSRGYLLRPPSLPFQRLWDQAPYRLSLSIREGPGDRYLQSPNRLTQIEAILRLSRPGRASWQAGIQARTRVPVEGLGALEASRLGLGNRPNPEVEQRLYADARIDLSRKLGRALEDIPPHDR